LPAAIRESALAIDLTAGDVEPLLGPANRFTGERRMQEIEAYVTEQFAAAGWQAKREAVVASRESGANVVAVKPGDTEALIVVGAHYDTVADTPGADDNAASVAALVAIARALSPFWFQRSIALVAFDFEETGFYGSLAFIDAHRQVIRAALILECVAYTDSRRNSQAVPPRFELLYPQQVDRLRSRESRADSLMIAYRRQSAALAALYSGSATQVGLPTITLRDPTDLPVIGSVLRRYFPAARHFARSDHLPFWLARLPALQLTDSADFRNPHYHTPSDTIDTLDYHFLSNVARATTLTAAHLAGPLAS
jgi:Zn-dependent M28 family amino/carboxypeptidase